MLFVRKLKRNVRNAYSRITLNSGDFPPEVWIENTNHCNAHCVMCPREKQTRDLGFMDLELFTKLVEEISRHKKRVKRLHLHNYGEPLMDKNLITRVKLAKSHGIAHVYFVTNASLLTKEKSRELIKAGLDEFKISFYGTDKATYNTTMKNLDFDKTLKNIKDFFEVRKELNAVKPKVVLQYLPQETNKGDISGFESIVSPLIDKKIGDKLNIFSLHNYGNGRDYVSTKDHSIPPSVCSYPWRTMVILQDGRVVICCLDFDGVQVMGNIKDNTIAEIWNSKAYNDARESFKKLEYGNGKYPICVNCNVIH